MVASDTTTTTADITLTNAMIMMTMTVAIVVITVMARTACRTSLTAMVAGVAGCIRTL
jgi:hypothetical protein